MSPWGVTKAAAVPQDGPCVPRANAATSPSPPMCVPICPHYIPTSPSSKIEGRSLILTPPPPLPPSKPPKPPKFVLFFLHFFMCVCKNKPSLNPESPALPGTRGVPMLPVPEPPGGQRGVLGGSRGGEKEGLELQLLPEEPGEEELS